MLTVPEERGGKGYAVRTLADLRFYPDAASSVARLLSAGYDVVVVTNQPDVANGLIEAAVLEEIHARVMEVTGVTSIRTCPHSREDACPCRKPLPGLLLDEAAHAGGELAARLDGRRPGQRPRCRARRGGPHDGHRPRLDRRAD